MPTVSYTEVDTFRRCAKRWDYKYRQRLKRIKKHVRLLRGEIIHEMLNAHVKGKLYKGYVGNDPWDVLAGYEDKYAAYFEEEKEEFGDIPGDCGLIFEGYLRKWRRDTLKYESSEEAVFLDLPNGLRFIGYIDKVALDEQGRRFIVDHKFVANIPTGNDRFSELQLLLYVWARRQSVPGETIDGVIWDYGRSKVPTKPEVLKAGGLSKRKNLDCDPHTYLRTIAEHNLNPADYQDMLAHLEGKEDSFFERVILPAPTEEMIAEVVDDFMQSSDEIKAKGAKKRCARTMNQFNCSGCDFRPLCEAEVRGHNAEPIRKAEYLEREPHGDE